MPSRLACSHTVQFCTAVKLWFTHSTDSHYYEFIYWARKSNTRVSIVYTRISYTWDLEGKNPKHQMAFKWIAAHSWVFGWKKLCALNIDERLLRSNEKKNKKRFWAAGWSEVILMRTVNGFTSREKLFSYLKEYRKLFKNLRKKLFKEINFSIKFFIENIKDKHFAFKSNFTLMKT